VGLKGTVVMQAIPESIC